MNRIIIGLLALALGLGIAIEQGAFADGIRTANIEVRVWEDVNDPERNFISARPEGGSWRTLGTIPLPLTDGVSSSGRFRYGDIALAVPLADDIAAPAVDIPASAVGWFRDECLSRGATVFHSGYWPAEREHERYLSWSSGGHRFWCEYPAVEPPTATPTPATATTGSGVGATTARLTLAEAAYVCRSEWANNASPGSGTAGNFMARLWGESDSRSMANGLSIDGAEETFIRSAGGTFIYEVTAARDSARWTVSCERVN